MAHERATGRGIDSELGFAESFILLSEPLLISPVPACLARTEDLSLNSPLLARPAGANVLPLANVFPRHRLPGWLVQPEGKFPAMPTPIYILKLRFLPVEPARGVRLIRVRFLTSRLVLMSDKPTWGVEQKVNLDPRRILHRPSRLTHPETRV
jgi:hypothetical protein